MKIKPWTPYIHTYIHTYPDTTLTNPAKSNKFNLAVGSEGNFSLSQKLPDPEKAVKFWIFSHKPNSPLFTEKKKSVNSIQYFKSSFLIHCDWHFESEISNTERTQDGDIYDEISLVFHY